jgi:glycine/D-amino acid oxidase-like deaminating enzyme
VASSLLGATGVDLRSGSSWWLEANPDQVVFPPLTEDCRCDVTIIGAGVTAALLALELADHGLSVVALDKRNAGRGSTAASTALLLAETDADFGELSRRFGPDVATRIWRLGSAAIDRIGSLGRRLPSAIGFAPASAYYLANSRRDLRRLRREERLRRAAGLDIELLERRDLEALSSLPHRGALRSRGAVVDPYRLAIAALAEAGRAGTRVFGRTTVTEFTETETGVRLSTDLGPRVEARELVVAAGYESSDLLRMRLGRLRSSYAFVSEPLEMPIPGCPPEAVFWETARPYLYVRPTEDGRLIAGGEDSAFAGDHRAESRLARRVRRIHRTLAQWFPQATIQIANGWAGTFGESPDALPWIGRPPGARRVHAALGFGGNGITFAQIAASLLAGEILGQAEKDLELFAFER